MTSREKIGQLFMVGFLGTSVTPDLASFIKEYKPGGVILFSRNLESVEQMVDLTNDLQACSPHSPLLISIDQEGGRVSRLPKGFTIFPPCDLLGRCNSTELAYAAAATIAKELRAVGVNMNMAPVLDVNSNPDNPVIGDRAFGTTPDVVCELGIGDGGGATRQQGCGLRKTLSRSRRYECRFSQRTSGGRGIAGAIGGHRVSPLPPCRCSKALPR